MNKFSINWKRILTVVAWSLLGSFLLFLLIAAGTMNKDRICQSVAINIITTDDIRYIQEKEVLAILTENEKQSLNGKMVNTIDLKSKESNLEKNLWIRNADLYFDHHDRLQVVIEQRVPVARVFCKDQSTFYLDDQGLKLPFSFKQIASVPVFTSFPESAMILNTADSLLLMQIRDMGLFLLKQPIWKAQIEQIELVGSEMVFIPKVGRHEILFGEGTMIEKKFKRLDIFYQRILNKTGWNAYSQLDLRFQKLLIGVRRDSASIFESIFIPVDTTQNIEVVSEKFGDSSQIEIKDTLSGAKKILNQPSNKLIEQNIKKDSITNKKRVENNSGSQKKNTSKDLKPKAVMLPGNSKDSTIKKQ